MAPINDDLWRWVRGGVHDFPIRNCPLKSGALLVVATEAA